MIDKEVIVYWAAFSSHEEEDWNMLYLEPQNLFEEIRKKSVPGLKDSSFLVCPSVTDKIKNTYIFKNPLDGKFSFDKNSNVISLNKEENYVRLDSIRKSTLKDTSILNYNIQWIFFSEEDINVEFTPPWFHKPVYTKYGSIIPGELNIGSWFRPYNAEILTWQKEGIINFVENEPLVYAKFNTDKKIKFVKFSMNKKLKSYADACVSSPRTIGKHLPLSKRYKRFKESKMNDLILNEIKNIVGNND